MQEIADALKKQRESKGYSIDDLFQRTRINSDFLRAIDAGQFDLLPDTYAKLFIKKYAQEVGLNVEEIMAQYDKLAPAPAPPKPTPPPVHHKRNFQPIIFIAIGIGIVALLVWQIGQQSEKDIAAPLDATLSAPTTSRPTTRPQNTSPAPNTNLTSRPTDTAPVVSPAPSTEQSATTVPDLGDQTPETAPTTASPVLNTPEIIPETNRTPTPEATTPETEPVLESDAQTALSPESLSAETPTEQQQAAPSPTETPVTPNQAPERLITNEPKIEPTTMPLPVVIAPEYPLLLSGIAQQTTQLVVKVDGRTLFDGVLQAGSRPRWTARNSLELTLTDRSALVLSLQNQPLQFDAATSQAIQLSIDRTQIRILPLKQ